MTSLGSMLSLRGMSQVGLVSVVLDFLHSELFLLLQGLACTGLSMLVSDLTSVGSPLPPRGPAYLGVVLLALGPAQLESLSFLRNAAQLDLALLVPD